MTVDLGANNDVTITGDALTALQLIDDVIFVDDTATHSTGSTKLLGVGAVATPTDAAITANDIGMLAMSLDRRLHVDAAIKASVALDVSAATLTVNAHAVTNAGTFLVQEDGASLTALQLVDNPVRAEDVASAGGHEGMVAMVIRDDALVANAAVDADGDYTFFRVNNDGALWSQLSAGNLGGCKMFNDIDLDEADIDVATGPCTVYAMYVVNTTASILHLKLFNTNAVTMGTTAATASLPIPANADSDGAGFVIPIPACGSAFPTALTVAVTTAAALDDKGAPGAGGAIATIWYQD